MPTRSPQALWETALGQLELQVTRPNFETWLRNTAGLHLDADEFVVGVPSDFAVEWLRSRMTPLISRTVSQLLGNPISISFQVLGAQAAAAPLSPDGHHVKAAHGPPAPDLDPRLTFESFTVVKSNRLAHRAARRVASGASTYNPLLVFGAPGLGKTHLLHAIGHHAAAIGKCVVALTGEAFVDQYGKAVRAGHPQTFRELFQRCDLFLLDDLPFLTTRAASQEQFFHVFNTLHARGCHLVVSVDTYPDRLAPLPSRLRSRLQAGLAVELLPPSPDERLAILKAKVSTLSYVLPESTLQLVAEQPYETIRELEGALNRIAAFADLTDAPLSLTAAKQALFPLQPPQPQPTPEAILLAVCNHFHLSLNQLTGPSRARDITYARHIAMYLLRCQGLQSLTQIGHLLGRRDHSTVLNAYKRITRERTALPQTRTALQQLEAKLQNPPAA